MQFTLQTLLLLFVVLWTSLAVFGGGGIAVFILAIVAALILNKRERPLTALLVLSGVALLPALVSLLLPELCIARESARRAGCFNNLRQINLALLGYEAKWKYLPPACVRDRNGRPMHSWRVLILPYLGHRYLYDQYKFDEPWDGPNNTKLFAERPNTYRCPDDEVAFRNRVATSYAAVVGNGALWRTDKSRSLDDPILHDQAGSTAALVEVAGSGIIWTEPRDFSLDDLRADDAKPSVVRLSSVHSAYHNGFFFHDTPAGAWVAHADGTVKVLPATAFASKKLKDWLSVGGFNEKEIGSDDGSINWTNICALVVWIASVGLLLYRARRSRKKPDEVMGI